MLAGDKPFTARARAADPYVHLDNRGFVLSDGSRGVLFSANALAWVSETLGLILEEARATRRQGDLVLGGFAGDDGGPVTLFGGSPSEMVTVVIDVGTVVALREQLTRR